MKTPTLIRNRQDQSVQEMWDPNSWPSTEKNRETHQGITKHRGTHQNQPLPALHPTPTSGHTLGTAKLLGRKRQLHVREMTSRTATLDARRKCNNTFKMLRIMFNIKFHAQPTRKSSVMIAAPSKPRNSEWPPPLPQDAKNHAAAKKENWPRKSTAWSHRNNTVTRKASQSLRCLLARDSEAGGSRAPGARARGQRPHRRRPGGAEGGWRRSKQQKGSGTRTQRSIFPPNQRNSPHDRMSFRQKNEYLKKLKLNGSELYNFTRNAIVSSRKKTKGCTRNKTQLQNTAEFFTEWYLHSQN